MISESRLDPFASPVLDEVLAEVLTHSVDAHEPGLKAAAQRVVEASSLSCGELDSLLTFVHELNSRINGRDQIVGSDLDRIGDAIAREYYGIGRRLSGYERAEGWASLKRSTARTDRMDRECAVGARVTGVVIAHEAFGMFVDVGWSKACLVQLPWFPIPPVHGPRDFPPLGSTVEIEILDPDRSSVYARLIQSG